MKKHFFILFALCAFSTMSFAQSGNGNDGSLIAQAKKLAKNAGCFAGYNGPIDAVVNETPCAETGTKREVVFYTKCTGNNCANFLPAILARVNYGCPFFNIGAPYVTCGE